MSWRREKEEISLQTITTYWSIAQPRYRKSSIQRVTREESIFVEIAGVNVSVRGVGIDLSVPPPCKLLRNDWKTVSFQGEIFDLNGLLHPGERNVRTKRPVVTLLPRIDAPFKFHVLLSPLPIIKIGIRVFSQGRGGTSSLSSLCRHWRFVQPRSGSLRFVNDARFVGTRCNAVFQKRKRNLKFLQVKN